MKRDRYIPTLVWLAVCTAWAPPVRCDEPVVSQGFAFFEQHVRPVLASKCYACHSSRTGKREGGLLLDTRAGMTAGGDGGQIVVPADVEASRLIQAIRYADSDLKMPPDMPLAPDVVARLEQWVRMGAPDPRDGPILATEPHLNPSDPVAGRDHWAFRRWSEQPAPVTSDSHWPRSPIDEFVLARLAEKQLHPAADADRRTLIRRLYVRLIGVPPSSQQVAEFLADPGADAIERLVDQLMGSPQFGERWGRHWLDLARYADSNGLDENFLFREAWRYRNWVLDAINADLPFDRFVSEQVAGDLLPFESIEQRDRQRIAAGFLVVGPKVLLGNDPQQRRMDVADEQLDTIGRAVLGQTLGCARCHDHKFDPIPTSDYYALAGIFTSTQVMEERYMLGQQRLMEQLVGLGSDGAVLDEAYETYWRESPQRKEQLKRAQSVVEHLKKGELDALLMLAAKHPEALADDVLETELTTEKRIESQEALIGRLKEAAGEPLPIPPRAMIPGDVAAPADEAIRLAGQFDRLGNSVPRGFLRVVTDSPPHIPPGHSGRLQFAAWLTDSQSGAGHLAARVLANRVWYHLIGRGIVRTVDNFGRTGEAPSHPELLDYLARRIVESGWSTKSLIREIVLSRTFAMSSRHDPAANVVDPDNQWLWRAHRRRLEPEVLRDAMLSVADQLDRSAMRSTVWYLGDQATAVGDNKVRRRTDFPCRSVYLPVIRNDLPELFDVFDFTDAHAATGMRPETMVATQGLFLLNDESVIAAAEAAAQKFLAENSSTDRGAMLDEFFERVTGNVATAESLLQLSGFCDRIQSHQAFADDPASELRLWTLVCQALFSSSHFQVME